MVLHFSDVQQTAELTHAHRSAHRQAQNDVSCCEINQYY